MSLGSERNTSKPSRPGICTSRKTSEGASLTMDSTASTPLHASPTTATESNDFSSFRSRERPAVSSSTIRVSMCGLLSIIRQLQGHHRSDVIRSGGDFNESALAVQRPQPFADILQADAGGVCVLHANAIVSYGQSDRTIDTGSVDGDRAAIELRSHAVAYRVLHQRLQDERRDLHVCHARLPIDFHAQAFTKPCGLDFQVVASKLHFLLDR